MTNKSQMAKFKHEQETPIAASTKVENKDSKHHIGWAGIHIVFT